MYNESGANADRMDLEALFQENFSKVYSKEKIESLFTGKSCSVDNTCQTSGSVGIGFI